MTKECGEDYKTCGYCRARFLDCGLPSLASYPACAKAGFWAVFFGADLCPNAPKYFHAVETGEQTPVGRAVSALKNLVSYWGEGCCDAKRELELKDEARAAIRALGEG
jgi:hypothetical protein